MPKTIRELADALNVSKQTIQYHYQRLPAKNQQKDSRGTNIISSTAERIIRSKITKTLLANKQQISSKSLAKTTKESNELVATLRRELKDLKIQRDNQLSTKDRQIDHLTKLIDQQQKLQLTTIAEKNDLKERVQKLSGLLEASELSQKQQENNKKAEIHKNKTNKSWWHFW